MSKKDVSRRTFIQVGGAVKTGENRLEVRVANLWLNRVRADAQLPPERCITRIEPSTWYDRCRESKPLPSGLLGPVPLQLTTHQEEPE